MKPETPAPPPEKHSTARQRLMELLEEGPLSAKELSASAGLSEKEVYAHLEHIRQTLQRRQQELEVEPASCRKCGFVFRKRDRLTKPGKCPRCRGEAITEPRFGLR